MTLLLFLAILSLLIFVHEAGHFFVAKRAGIRVEEFGFGLPPRIVGKRVGETIYSINLLPFGGFVRLFGEDQESIDEDPRALEKKDLERSFFAQKKRVRVAVVLAGVVMNFLLGVVIFSILYSFIGIPTPGDGVQIIELFKDSPASSVFELGDEVLSVDGQAVVSTEEFQIAVGERRGEEVTFEVLRDGSSVSLAAVPRLDPPTHIGPPLLRYSSGERRIGCFQPSSQEGALGVVISSKTEMARYPIWQMPFRGAWFGVGVAYHWGVNIVRGLEGMLAQLACGSVPKDIGGPVEIAYLVSEVSQQGVVPLMNLVAVLSINLTIVNLLPIPALDGGRLLFIGLEAILGRKISARAERFSHAIGMALLLALMAAITLQDILRRSGAESLGALLKRVTRM